MKIVIVGLGGIGGIVGGKLALKAQEDGKNEIIFFCRGKILEAIEQKGLEFRAQGNTHVVHAKATDDAKEIGVADVVFFAVKNYSIEAAAKDIAPAIGPNTIVVPLLNGVEAFETLKKTFPNSNVVGGCIYISAFIVEPGVVEQTGNWMKIVFGGGAKHTALRDALAAAGIETVASENIETEMWTKFVSISAFATATSMFRRNAGEIFADDKSSDYFKGLLTEIVSVAKAKGVKLPDNAEGGAFDRMHGFPPETKTSMQRDFEKGGANELEALTGYICREAKRLGVSVPLYEEAYGKLK